MAKVAWIGTKYELIEQVGRGGMATVWRGRTHGVDGFSRPVAIKRVLPHLAEDPRFSQMIAEEARVVASLHHPNIVQVHDFERDSTGEYFIVMEWVEGLNLGQYVQSYRSAKEPTPWHYIAAIGIEVLRALATAHERRNEQGEPSPVVHRDVSPSNVLLGTNGVVKLADFGLARAMDRLWQTGPGTFKGKLAYIAPERLVGGGKATHLSDIYCLGIVLWESLAAERLFAGGSDAEVVLRVRDAEVPHLGEVRPDLPRDLVDIVHCALAKDPGERFQRARAMLRALSNTLRKQSEPTDAEPLGLSVSQAMGRSPSGLMAAPTEVDPRFHGDD